MTGENSPDFACGQILFGLKRSKLHYLVNKTPYSMYVTIRKKFLKDASIVQNGPNRSIDEVNLAKTELISVNEKNKDLEAKIA